MTGVDGGKTRKEQAIGGVEIGGMCVARTGVSRGKVDIGGDDERRGVDVVYRV